MTLQSIAHWDLEKQKIELRIFFQLKFSISYQLYGVIGDRGWCMEHAGKSATGKLNSGKSASSRFFSFFFFAFFQKQNSK